MESFVKRILEKEKISYKTIQKSALGFTDTVYFAGETVVKIATEEGQKKKLLKEISVYKNVKLNCIPRYLADGRLGEGVYLILSKVKGQSLYSLWHTLNDSEREACVKQIAEILIRFHRQSPDFLQQKADLWENHIVEALKQQKQGLDRLGIPTEKIARFIENNNLFRENTFGLLHNDAHFDNFLYDNGTLTLLDFDRVVYAPIDYEMLIFKTMCDRPKKFASDETVVFDRDFVNVYPWFQKYYRQLFQVQNVEKRIKVYQFLYLCEQALRMENRSLGDAWARELTRNFDL